jgi:hypothetical protein
MIAEQEVEYIENWSEKKEYVREGAFKNTLYFQFDNDEPQIGMSIEKANSNVRLDMVGNERESASICFTDPDNGKSFKLFLVSEEVETHEDNEDF